LPNNAEVKKKKLARGKKGGPHQPRQFQGGVGATPRRGDNDSGSKRGGPLREFHREEKSCLLPRREGKKRKLPEKGVRCFRQKKRFLRRPLLQLAKKAAPRKERDEGTLTK